MEYTIYNIKHFIVSPSIAIVSAKNGLEAKNILEKAVLEIYVHGTEIKEINDTGFKSDKGGVIYIEK